MLKCSRFLPALIATFPCRAYADWFINLTDFSWISTYAAAWVLVGLFVVAAVILALRMNEGSLYHRFVLPTGVLSAILGAIAALIPPCSIHGVALTIRKFNSHRFKMRDLVQAGMLTQELAEQLADFVVRRKNILICGGTSSGKTTFLNSLAEFIPDDQRIVLIEDTAEIQIQKQNIVRFEARREQNGLSAVTIRDLLKATLRHRPDRIILGEIRGGEAFDLLQLLNTGHSGTLSTVHANSAAQGISRFTTCVLQSGVEIPYLSIKTNIADSLNVVVQIERRPGKRFVSEVLEIRGYDLSTDQYHFHQVAAVNDGALAPTAPFRHSSKGASH